MGWYVGLTVKVIAFFPFNHSVTHPRALNRTIHSLGFATELWPLIYLSTTLAKLSTLLKFNFIPPFPQPNTPSFALNECVCLCTVLYLGVSSGSLQGSNRLQHVLQFTTLVQCLHIAATSDTLLTDEHPWDLHSNQKTNRDASGKCAVIDFQCCDSVKRYDNKCQNFSTVYKMV